ncbi:MAG: CDP-glycerol glycerophosphotransferase family protein [Clostridiales bacterium]|nr:CDP-glycerol glycerophosphotransferase family protein [Clostridiales bacterium]
MNKIKEILYPVLQRLRFLPFIIAFESAKRRKLQENKILMFTNVRGELGGNLKQIKDYIEKKRLDFTVTAYTSLNMPPKLKLAREAATSRFIMIDDFEPVAYVMRLRKGQQLVQVWHGMGAFKKFGYSRDSAVKTSLTHKNYTKAIVSAPDIVAIYHEAFAIPEHCILPTGIPRTDLLFDGEYIEKTKARLYDKYPGLLGKKICLFAPTFRGSDVKGAYYPEGLFDAEKLARGLGSDWAVVTKYHPFIKNAPHICTGNVVDMTCEREINDILFITDVLVTDYSSVIFENAIVGNTLVLYAPDLDDYFDSRGFYFDWGTYCYGAFVKDFESLAKTVKTAENDSEKLAEFRQKFTGCCDGRATERFVKEILENKAVLK